MTSKFCEVLNTLYVGVLLLFSGCFNSLLSFTLQVFRKAKLLVAASQNYLLSSSSVIKLGRPSVETVYIYPHYGLYWNRQLPKDLLASPSLYVTAGSIVTVLEKSVMTQGFTLRMNLVSLSTTLVLSSMSGCVNWLFIVISQSPSKDWSSVGCQISKFLLEVFAFTKACGKLTKVTVSMQPHAGTCSNL